MEYPISPESLELVAERFKVLAEPARLRILSVLHDGEKTVSEVMAATGLRQANASKHLQCLYGAGFVDRRKDGLYVYYRLTNEDVLRLCDVMGGQVMDEADARRPALARPVRA